MVDHEQPVALRLSASGFRVPTFSSHVSTGRVSFVQNPPPVQHREVSRHVHPECLQLDAWARRQGATIAFADGVEALRGSVNGRQDGARLIQGDNGVQIVPIERLLKRAM
jgi:hypothetical protein